MLSVPLLPLARIRARPKRHHHTTKHHKKRHHTKHHKKRHVATLRPANPGIVHLADRFTGGYTDAQGSAMTRAGGALAWFDQQLTPDSVPESSRATTLWSWFPLLANTPQQRWDSQRAMTGGSWEHGIDLAAWTILRRVHSERGVLESMVEFWSDHLHVPTSSDGWYWRQQYDTLIRSRALGKFSTLLVEASLHPAMLVYLNNAQSTAAHPDENQARELLELHTVGRGHYGEDEVKASARILSGWTVKWPWDTSHPDIATWAGWYDPRRHATAPAKVLGFSSNGDGRGGQTAKDYLTYLAHQPATGQRIATKLAVRFVSDTPSPALISALVKVYLANDTDIRPVLRALVRHPEFAAAAKRKVRPPVADLIATMRVLGVDVQPPVDRQSAAHTIVYTHGGVQPYSWPRPDGPPDAATAYASAGRMLQSFTMHWDLAGGYWPTREVAYRSPGAFVPTGRFTIAQYADHLCRLVHHTGADATTTRAVAQALGYPASRIVDPDTAEGRDLHRALSGWLGVRAIGAVLDHPRHLTH